MTYFCNFGIPSISQELLELETLNLMCQCKMSGLIGKIETGSVISIWQMSVFSNQK